MKMNSPEMIKEAVNIIETCNEKAYKEFVTELINDVNPTHKEFGKMQELVAQEFIGRIIGRPIAEQTLVFKRILPFIESVTEWYIENFYVRYCQDLEYHDNEADPYDSTQEFFSTIGSLKSALDLIDDDEIA